MAPVPLSFNTPENLPPCTLKKVGYVFAGWSLSLGGPVAYVDRANVVNLTNVEDTTVNLYAVWTERAWDEEDYLNADGIEFSSSGDAVWVPDTVTSHNGVASMRSSAIGAADEREKDVFDSRNDGSRRVNGIVLVEGQLRGIVLRRLL